MGAIIAANCFTVIISSDPPNYVPFDRVCSVLI